MKTRQIIHKFKVKDDRNVILRNPSWSDLDYLNELINSVIDENGDIGFNKQVTRN